MKIRIYQIDPDRDDDKVMFFNLANTQKKYEDTQIKSEIYDCVYDGDVSCDGLEDIFYMFNRDCPDGHNGRSMSVSDIVEVVDSDKVTPGFYFCDSIGFEKVEFDRDEAEPYHPKRIKVLMVEPGKRAYEKEIGTKLEDLQAAVGGTIETYYPFSDQVVIVCDDEGKINGKTPNRAIYDEEGKIEDVIFGSFFICDCSTYEFRSLPEDMMQKYKKEFLLPERFLKLNGDIHAIKFDPEREAAR